MGGAGGDCQYLFACDVLGTNTGHMPRHAKKYADLASEYARIQQMRIDAFKAFVTDVEAGDYPSGQHLVKAPGEEMAAFRAALSNA
jgi:3-methyl-2-oxobutanoate hydroxymethyltransferase